MTDERNFNEVYFTDVRVKDSQRLGAVGDGWKVSLVTLMNERLAAGAGSSLDYTAIMSLAADVRTEAGPALGDSAFRERLADWYVQSEGLKFTRFRTMTALSRGQTPGPESSIGKIIAANQLQDLANSAVEMEDQFGIIDEVTVSPLRAAFQHALLFSPGLRIAGGTDEILKNIIAERVLGLPGDIRVDKDAAFKDLLTGR
jgi:alkylation response protein AidB-like acyl-CoA dehydrogenase